MPKKFDENLDKTLTTVKVRNEREGFTIELKSYNNWEPKLKVTRYYKSEKGWMKDEKNKYPRFSMRLIHWLIENTGALDGAFQEWSKTKGKASDAPSSDEPF